MDIWGVSGVEAEAELLAAITTFFKRVGITSKDVGTSAPSTPSTNSDWNRASMRLFMH